jgi:hypothetical protein
MVRLYVSIILALMESQLQNDLPVLIPTVDISFNKIERFNIVFILRVHKPLLAVSHSVRVLDGMEAAAESASLNFDIFIRFRLAE